MTLQHPQPRLSKLQVALYLLREPAWYPDLCRRVQLNLRRVLLPAPVGRGRDVAEPWAAERAISAAEALAALGGDERRLTHLLLSLRRNSLNVILDAEPGLKA